MSILVKWADIITKIDPTQSNHPYLYDIHEEGKQYTALLSNEQYASYLQNKSSSKITKCQKLTLQEIINISLNLIHNPYDGAPTRVLSKLFWDNAFSADYNFEQFFVELQQEAQDNIKTNQAPHKLYPKLKQMCERARAKRVAAATQGIWGKIKYYIWSWFKDQSFRLKDEPQVKEARSAEKYIEESLKQIASTLQSRILMNMNFFEEKIGIPEQERNNQNKAGYQKFATPNDIGKKWLTTFSEDKMPGVSEDAQDCRKRILQLRNIWKEVIEKQQKLFPATPPTAPATSPQTPLLHSNS